MEEIAAILTIITCLMMVWDRLVELFPELKKIIPDKRQENIYLIEVDAEVVLVKKKFIFELLTKVGICQQKL